MSISHEIRKLIDEVDWKLETLPNNYFIDYFEKEFLVKLKELIKELK